MKKILDGKEVLYEIVIEHRTFTKLRLLDRIRVLFGCKIIVYSELYCNHKTTVMARRATAIVTPIFKKAKKPQGNGVLKSAKK